MRQIALCAIVLAGVTVLLLSSSAAQDAENAAIRAAIENYFQGHATGQGEHFAKVFHPESRLFFLRDGQLATRTSAEYIAGASGKAPADEPQRKRRILNIDRTGDAAVVKLELDYPDALLTDYMSMLKINGQWKIVNKTFVRQPARKR